MARPRKFTKNSALDVEVPLDLRLSNASIRRLTKASKYGVRNTIGTVAKYVLEPTRDTAIKLSPIGIGGKETRWRTIQGGRTTYIPRGQKKAKRIRSYRAGIRKKGSYATRGRADSIGDVTLFLSVKTNEYYNFVANFWEHGWKHKRSGRTYPGNQFMTKAIKANLSEIRDRYARAIAKAVEIAPEKIRARHLKGIG
jgi:hypothetical protein